MTATSASPPPCILIFPNFRKPMIRPIVKINHKHRHRIGRPQTNPTTQEPRNISQWHKIIHVDKFGSPLFSGLCGTEFAFGGYYTF